MRILLTSTMLTVSAKASVSLASTVEGPATDVVGRVFQLNEEKPLTEGLSSGRVGLFKNLDSCIVERDASGDPTKLAFDFGTNEEKYSRSKSMSLNIQGGGPVPGFVISGSLNVDWSRTTTSLLNQTRASLDAYQLNMHYDLTDSIECRGASNLDETFLRELSALPIGDLFDPTHSGWQSYASFLQEHGSHVLVTATTGSRFTREAKTEDTRETMVEKLKVKACLEAKSLAAAVTPGKAAPGVKICGGGGYHNTDDVSTSDEMYRNYALGGAPDSVVKAVISNENNMPDDAQLTQFMSEASDSVAPVKFKFEPIWEILDAIYTTPCLESQQAQDNENCQMLQRVTNLQAYYEGILAWKCTEVTTEDFGVIQELRYQEEINRATGVRRFECMNHETGCYSDDDCHLHWQSGWHRHACFMYGADAVSYESVPFADAKRSVVVNSMEEAPEWADQKGNNYCTWSPDWGRWGCRCRTSRGWKTNDVHEERAIYTQSISQSMATQIAKYEAEENLHQDVSVE
mmetsp:Transcript_20026/g.48105  ORF Transcript_20026/g.48105 Transcript_20026/m.48105 type:complete len:517 (-) Transcript_20026:100-1650(-)